MGQPLRPAVKHDFVGHVNPRCRICTRTPIDAQRHPDAGCERPRPLFEQHHDEPLGQKNLPATAG